MFTRQEKLLLFILASIQFSHIVDFMLMMPLGSQLMRLLTIDAHQFGLLVSCYTLAAGISGFASSFFIDRFDRKNVLLFFFVGFSLGTIACGLVNTYMALLVTRSLTGIFGGVLGSLVMSIVSDQINYERRGSALGVVMTSFSLASIVGVPFSLYLADKFSWQTPFVLLGVLSLVVAFGSAFFIPAMKDHLAGAEPRTHRQAFDNVVSILMDRNQRLALIFMFTLIFGHFAIIPFLSPSMVMNVGLTESQLPLIYLTGGLVSILSSPIIGRLSDKYGKHKILLVAGTLAMIPLFVITHLGPTPLFIVLTLAGLFFVFSGGRMIPANAMVSATVTPDRRGSFMSLLSCVQNLGSATSSYVAGLIVYNGADGHLENYRIVGLMAVGFSLIALVLSQKIKAHPSSVSTTAAPAT